MFIRASRFLIGFKIVRKINILRIVNVCLIDGMNLTGMGEGVGRTDETAPTKSPKPPDKQKALIQHADINYPDTLFLKIFQK